MTVDIHEEAPSADQVTDAPRQRPSFPRPPSPKGKLLDSINLRSVTPPATLSEEDMPNFSSSTTLASFRTGPNGEYLGPETKPLPDFLRRYLIEKLKTESSNASKSVTFTSDLFDAVNADGNMRANDFSLIPNYEVYREAKWQYMLRTLRESQATLPSNQFVGLAGTFEALMNACYDPRTMEVLIVRHQGVYYMKKIERRFNRGPRPQAQESADGQEPATSTPNLALPADPSVDGSSPATPRVVRHMASKIGLFFQRFATATAPEEESNITNHEELLPLEANRENRRPLNEMDKYYELVNSQFGQHTIVALREIDAIDEQGRRIELKTYKEREDEKQKRLQTLKKLEWWAQAKLGNISRFVMAIRDHEGSIVKIAEHTVDELADEEARAIWKLDKVLITFNAILSLIKSTITQDDPNKIYRLKSFKSDVELFELEEDDKDGAPEIPQVLPKWFIESGSVPTSMDAMESHVQTFVPSPSRDIKPNMSDSGFLSPQLAI